MIHTYEYFYRPDSEFDYDMLDEFCKAIDVDYHVGWYAGDMTVLFVSDNYHHIQEVREQLPNVHH